MTALAPTLQAFFTDRPADQRGASEHTIAAYRDTWRLLLGFASQRTGKNPSQLDIADLDAPLRQAQARAATRIVSHSRTAPACETGPFPSEDTATRAVRALLSTSEAPSTHGGQDPGQVLFAQVKGTLIQTNDRR